MKTLLLISLFTCFSYAQDAVRVEGTQPLQPGQYRVMPLIQRTDLRARIEALKAELEQALARANQLQGAILECEHWLAVTQPEVKDSGEKAAPKDSPAAAAAPTNK